MKAAPAESVALADALDAAATAWLKFRAGASLSVAVDQAAAEARQAAASHPRLRAAVLDVATTAVRQLALVDAAIDRLATRKPDVEVDALLAVALGQWFAARYPAHTLVDQTVEAAKSRDSTRAAAGFVNALLRNAIRGGESLVEALRRDEVVRWNAPRWWITRLRKTYPALWRGILEAAQVPPPLTLRVNTRRITCDGMLQRLFAEGFAATRIGEVAIRLECAVPVEQIPGFAAGEVSVQDAGAQLAARWLAARDGERVLDACAAPGGKTAHLLERADVFVDAIEADAARAARISGNLSRLGLAGRARVIVADAGAPESWFDGRPYHRILLDAPCTASGIVRRHPDIPWLRRSADVALLARAQARLLDALWPLLAPTGRLLYVVCSVFPEEGTRQVESFVARHADAVPLRLPPQSRLPNQSGEDVALQLLPRVAARADGGSGLAADTPVGDLAVIDADAPCEHDGFCYALIEKRR